MRNSKFEKLLPARFDDRLAARSLPLTPVVVPMLTARIPRLLAAGGRSDQPSPAGGRRPHAFAATATAAAAGRLPPLTLSGLSENDILDNGLPKVSGVARPHDAFF